MSASPSKKRLRASETEEAIDGTESSITTHDTKSPMASPKSPAKPAAKSAPKSPAKSDEDRAAERAAIAEKRSQTTKARQVEDESAIKAGACGPFVMFQLMKTGLPGTFYIKLLSPHMRKCLPTLSSVWMGTLEVVLGAVRMCLDEPEVGSDIPDLFMLRAAFCGVLEAGLAHATAHDVCEAFELRGPKTFTVDELPVFQELEVTLCTSILSFMTLYPRLPQPVIRLLACSNASVIGDPTAATSTPTFTVSLVGHPSWLVRFDADNICRVDGISRELEAPFQYLRTMCAEPDSVIHLLPGQLASNDAGQRLLAAFKSLTTPIEYAGSVL